jgi:hypothetical protein
MCLFSNVFLGVLSKLFIMIFNIEIVFFIFIFKTFCLFVFWKRKAANWTLNALSGGVIVDRGADLLFGLRRLGALLFSAGAERKDSEEKHRDTPEGSGPQLLCRDLAPLHSRTF